MRLAGGGFEYQGGETRLISVPNFCLYQDLLESLERLAGSAAGSHSGSSASVRLKCPSKLGNNLESTTFLLIRKIRSTAMLSSLGLYSCHA